MNRLLTICVVVLATITAGTLVPGKASAGGPNDAYASADIGIDQFYDALTPFGDWVADERFGYVWYPNAVDQNWRPYAVGNWIYTEQHGWYWDSPEPFAWAVYHYGRWGFDSDYGWYWVPGETWSPAWVEWRYSDDYVGWAPEPPIAPASYGGYGGDWAYDSYDPYGDVGGSYFGFGLSTGAFAFSFGSFDRDRGYGYGLPRRTAPLAYAPVAERWTFVRPRHLVAPAVRTHAVQRTNISLVFNNTKTVYRPRYREGDVYNIGMPRKHWSKVTRRHLKTHRVHRVTNRPHPYNRARRAQRGGSRDVFVYAPRVNKTVEVRRPPKKVVQKQQRRRVATKQAYRRGSARAHPPRFERAAAKPNQGQKRAFEDQRRRSAAARKHRVADLNREGPKRARAKPNNGPSSEDKRGPDRRVAVHKPNTRGKPDEAAQRKKKPAAKPQAKKPKAETPQGKKPAAKKPAAKKPAA
ncbi:MAG: DUF6600 domain-containing protein, partial [Pseudomonadota bacterium]